MTTGARPPRVGIAEQRDLQEGPCAPVSTTSSPHCTSSSRTQSAQTQTYPDRSQLSDSKLLCLATAQALLGFNHEDHRLRFCYWPGHLFPHLPGQPDYK
jgi:hypothetical protein